MSRLMRMTSLTVAGGGSSESTETLTNIEMPPDCRIMYPELMKVINLQHLTNLKPPHF